MTLLSTNLDISLLTGSFIFLLLSVPDRHPVKHSTLLRDTKTRAISIGDSQIILMLGTHRACYAVAPNPGSAEGTHLPNGILDDIGFLVNSTGGQCPS